MFLTFYEYKAVEKHFPGMTYTEYLLINDKIRITPNE